MDKLIIVNCVHQEAPYFPEEARVNMPKTIQEVAQSVREARDAGAAVAHVHQRTDAARRAGAFPEYWNREDYLELNRLIRQIDIIFEHRGANPTGGSPGIRFGQYHEDPDKVAARKRELQQIKDLPLPDASPIIIGAQHMDWGVRQNYVMPTHEELEPLMRHMLAIGVKPKFECNGADSFYNVRWLADRGLLKQPYWLELCMGTRGPTFPPSNIEELLYFTKRLPEHSVWHTWNMAPPIGTLTPQEGLVFLTQAITLGGHVRVGMEDSPYNWDGTVAKSNAQIIEGIVKVARAIGREVATPAEAREMLGLPPRPGSQ